MGTGMEKSMPSAAAAYVNLTTVSDEYK